jgi:hypothetical protein
MRYLLLTLSLFSALALPRPAHADVRDLDAYRSSDRHGATLTISGSPVSETSSLAFLGTSLFTLAALAHGGRKLLTKLKDKSVKPLAEQALGNQSLVRES